MEGCSEGRYTSSSTYNLSIPKWSSEKQKLFRNQVEYVDLTCQNPTNPLIENIKFGGGGGERVESLLIMIVVNNCTC